MSKALQKVHKLRICQHSGKTRAGDKMAYLLNISRLDQNPVAQWLHLH